MTEPVNLTLMATFKQDAYAEARRRYREEVFLPYLAERELPGTPETPFVHDPLADEPTRHYPILGDA